MPVIAMSLASVPCRWPVAAEVVRSDGRRDEVVVVDAVATIALVIESHPFWDRPDEMLVDDPVRHWVLAVRAYLAVAVARRSERAEHAVVRTGD